MKPPQQIVLPSTLKVGQRVEWTEGRGIPDARLTGVVASCPSGHAVESIAYCGARADGDAGEPWVLYDCDAQQLAIRVLSDAPAAPTPVKPTDAELAQLSSGRVEYGPGIAALPLAAPERGAVSCDVSEMYEDGEPCW